MLGTTGANTGFEEKEGKSKAPSRQVHKARRDSDLELIAGRRATHKQWRNFSNSRRRKGEASIPSIPRTNYAMTKRRLIEPSGTGIDAGTDNTSTTKLETHGSPAMDNSKAPQGIRQPTILQESVPFLHEIDRKPIS